MRRALLVLAAFLGGLVVAFFGFAWLASGIDNPEVYDA